MSESIANGANGASGTPVRVCYVIDRLVRAGTESQLLLTIKQLDRDQVTPFLCLLDGLDASSQELMPADCQTIKLGVKRLGSFHAARQAVRFWRFLRREKIDIVQVYFPDSTRFAAPVAKAAGVKRILGSRRNIGHSMTNRDKWIARFYNRCFIDKIVANCEAARQSVIEQECVEPERVVVVRNTIDLDRFSDIPSWTPKPEGVPRKVGMVGNLRYVKGPDVFIEAARIILRQYPDTTFEIAGGGDPTPYQQLIDDLGIAGSVKLLGSIDDVPGFLAGLDVAVLPSRAEGLSNALLEYMAAGRPVVATDVGGSAEVLGPLTELCCIAPSNSQVLAERIGTLLSQPSVAEACATSSRRRVSDLHGPQSLRKLHSELQGQ